jgi:uroporphyrinogen-III synthase
MVVRRVLVTRPQPGADETAHRLKAMGFAPVVLPLTEIVPVAIPQLPIADDVDAVIVTSVNAVRHAPAGLLRPHFAKPLFAVGDATAGAAAAAGFTDVRSASGTAVDLAALIASRMPRGARLLHLAGVDRTAGFAEQLERLNFPLQVMDVYAAERVSYATDFLISTFAEGDLWGALALSLRAGEFLAEIAARHEFDEAFEKTKFFCISQKVAAPLRNLNRGTVLCSDEPTEASVLHLLSSRQEL